MSAPTAKRLAADIMKVGENRVRIKDGETQRAEDALTREDIRGLIEEGIIYAQRYVGHRQKPLAKRKGRGSRKGSKYSRKGAKETWMERIRAQRSYLELLLKNGNLKPEYRRQIYLKIKGGAFKGKSVLLNYLKENGMLAKEPQKAPSKAERRRAFKKNAASAPKAKAAEVKKAEGQKPAAKQQAAANAKRK